MTVNLTADTFASEVIESSVPVLVDFWAPWCGPCRVMNPIITELAQEYEGSLKVAKLDVDTAKAIASQYNVTAIPTLLIFKNGEEVDRIAGLATKSVIADRLAALDILSTAIA
ncbi:MAG: thioredoxin [Symploca sp. SIO2B6]|nr:thioredoxin [Symploca sp. SIO2B6]